jgi:hypothetical protein
MENIEIKTINLVAGNGKHIRKATRIVIDGYAIDFTELLTKKMVARYLESRKAQQHQAEVHATVESYGG